MRAKVARSPPQHYPLNSRAALVAWLTGPAIYLKMLLKFAAPIHIIQSSSFENNTIIERLADGVVQTV